MAVLITGALPVRPSTAATPLDLSVFDGPHLWGCPPAKTRRPAGCVATSAAGESPPKRCFYRPSTRSRQYSVPRSIGDRSSSPWSCHTPWARPTSSRWSFSAGRAQEARRRRPVKRVEFSSPLADGLLDEPQEALGRDAGTAPKDARAMRGKIAEHGASDQLPPPRKVGWRSLPPLPRLLALPARRRRLVVDIFKNRSRRGD